MPGNLQAGEPQGRGPCRPGDLQVGRPEGRGTFRPGDLKAGEPSGRGTLRPGNLKTGNGNDNGSGGWLQSPSEFFRVLAAFLVHNTNSLEPLVQVRLGQT